MTTTHQLADFIAAATGPADATRLVLSADDSSVTTRSGRVARWVDNLRTSRNSETTRRFIDSLRETYGTQITARLVEENGLGRLSATGKPLKSRLVCESVIRADRLKIEIRQHNARIADMYAALPTPVTVTSLLQAKIDEAVRQLEPPNPEVVGLIDMDGVSRDVEEAILNAGRSPDRQIEMTEAAEIAQEIAGRAVEEAQARLNGPEMSPPRPDAELRNSGNADPTETLDPAVIAANPQFGIDAPGPKPLVSPYVSRIEDGISRHLTGSAFRSLPGGENLTEEIAGNVDVGRAVIRLSESDLRNRAQGAGGAPSDEADVLASAAVRDAQQAVFLHGYGVRTASGRSFELLQQVFDRHPHVRDLEHRWGVKINASALSQRTLSACSDRLAARLHKDLSGPEKLPAASEPVKERVAQSISQAADELVGEFIVERTDQLASLLQQGAKDEYPPALAQIVMHRSAPADQMTDLLTMQRLALDNLAATICKPTDG